MSDPTSDVSDAMCSYLYVLTAVRASFLSLLKFLTHSLAIACLT